MNRLLCGCFVFTLTFLIGCGGQPTTPQMVPVAGKVQRMDGKPISQLVLTFHPMDDNNKRCTIQSELLNEKGEFTTHCLPGKYRVTLAPIPTCEQFDEKEPAQTTTPPKDPGTVPLRPSYRNVNTTPIEFTVPASGKEDFLFTVAIN